MSEKVEIDAASINDFFIVMMASIVYLMQVGFAFLEAGSVRSKNTINILIKNLLDSLFSIIAYWILGYALAFGDNGNPFCGGGNFALSHMDPEKYSLFFFQYVFAATATTIVSGAVAERCEFIAYIVYSVFISAFVYPVVSHWVWDSTGWLNVGIKYYHDNGTIRMETHFQDFAGSCVVHVVGGVAAFVGAAFLGARIGKFCPETKKPRPVPGHSVPFSFLGAFFLFFGFFAFNGGSQLHITAKGDGGIVALAMINTIISAAMAAFVALFCDRFIFKRKWSASSVINGSLSGLVAICAGCNTVYPWAACVIGLIAGFSYVLWSYAVLAMKVDDPLDAVAVHFGGGLWGTFSVVFFNFDRGILFKWNVNSGLDLGWQIVGLLAIIGWTVALSCLVFGILYATKRLRVSPEIEEKGLDMAKHGMHCYPQMAIGQGLDADEHGVQVAYVVPPIATQTPDSDFVDIPLEVVPDGNNYGQSPRVVRSYAYDNDAANIDGMEL